MGLLYLRLTLPGSELWKWFEGMMEDQDEFQAKRQGPPMCVVLHFAQGRTKERESEILNSSL